MNDFVLSLFGWKDSLCSRVVLEDRSLLPTHPKTPKNSHYVVTFSREAEALGANKLTFCCCHTVSI